MSSAGFAYVLSLVYLVIAAFWTSPDKPMQFFDPHGMFMVFVGTAIISIIAVPWQYIRRFFAMILTVSRKHHDDTLEVLTQIVQVAEFARTDIQKAKAILESTNDAFLKDAIELLIEGYNEDDISQILRRQIEVQKEREASDAKMFKNLGKYPPATGLVGTVMGMIALLGTLGQEGSESKVGPAMSVAMSATLYGVILANIIILPVADNLIFRSQKTIAKREMIIEGILMARQRLSPVMVRQMLLSHLSPHQRTELRKPGAEAA